MIQEGPIDCYWCKESILYTISSTHWYCKTCQRYTSNTKVGEYYKGHICGPRRAIDPEHTVVMLECLSKVPGCNQDLIILTQAEYQRDLKKTELKDYLESRDFYNSLQAKFQKVRTIVVERKKVLVERIPMLANKESEEYKAAFAAFDRMLERKAERRARKKAERQEMRMMRGERNV